MQKLPPTKELAGSSEENSRLSRLDKRQITISRFKRKILKHVILIRAILLVGVLVSLFLIFLLILKTLRSTSVGFYANLARNFVFTPPDAIKSIEGRTNILILGKGGQGHEAPDLTDTIIFASFSHDNPSLTLISLPRDIWISELRAKLNSIYYWGNRKEKGGGIVLAKASVEEIFGQPVHYGVVVDFSGFRQVIDVLDGIDVEVERGFTDEKYPIAGRENDLCDGDLEYKCRYEIIKFEEGNQHMDGEIALKFVRSRNAEGDEGTDFARAARQQKVIDAIKNKILSREVLLSPKKLLALKDALMKSTETDIDMPAVAILARRVLQARNSVSSHVLPEDLLINPPKSPKYDNLYVFIPKDEDWNEIHKWVEDVLDE